MSKAAAERKRAHSSRDIDARHPTPLYHQIFLILRGRIEDGSYPDGSLLPSEQALSALYGVSRITAKRALDELAVAGLAIRERGRGTWVRFESPAPVVRSSVEGLLENLLAMGLKTEVDVLEFDYVPAPPDVAEALACRSGETVQRAVRVRRLKGEPFSYLLTHVPEAIGRSYSRHDLAARPLLTLLERSGVIVAGAEQTITATVAGARVASALEVEVGAPLLRISRVVRGADGRPVEYIVGLYRPDRYQFRLDLTRSYGDGQARWTPTDDGEEGA